MKFIYSAILVFLCFTLNLQAQVPQPSRPDGKEADMSKPVQVFILMGQSNMLGFGAISGGEKSLEHAVKNEKLYPYLIDDAGSWTTRKDVRNVRVMCSGSGPWKAHKNEWMTINGKIGPEIGIGHYVGEAIDAPVLILKSCIGNRALGWDLLPPGAEGYAGNPEMPRKPKDVKGWYAGVQYDGDVRAALEVLQDLGTYYPGATKHEVAGFFFFQGAKDCGKGEWAAAYEKNLVAFIKALRKDFNAPKAPFVCATMGESKKGSGGNKGLVLNAQLAVDGDTGKYPEFKGNVKTFYSHPVAKGGGANGHYGGHAQTYMNVGEGMGKAMVELLKTAPAAEKKEEKKEVGKKGGSLAPEKQLSQEDKAAQDIKSLLVYLKVSQPQIEISGKKYPAATIHRYMLGKYKQNKAEYPSAQMFIEKLATKSPKGNVYFVITRDGKRISLKQYFLDYLRR